MKADRPVPDRVVDWLQASGLSGIAAAIAEGLGPLGPLAAQLTYLVAPVLDRPGEGPLKDLAGWLEDPSRIDQLAERLRRGGSL